MGTNSLFKALISSYIRYGTDKRANDVQSLKEMLLLAVNKKYAVQEVPYGVHVTLAPKHFW